MSFFFAFVTFDWSLAIFIFGSSLDDDWLAVLLPLLGIVLLESNGLVFDDEDDLEPMLLSAGYWDLKIIIKWDKKFIKIYFKVNECLAWTSV